MIKKNKTVLFVLFCNHKYLTTCLMKRKYSGGRDELLNFKVTVFSRLFLKILGHNILWKFKDVIYFCSL